MVVFKRNKRKVEALIKEHGYTTNIAAKFKNIKVKTIGLIVLILIMHGFSLALAIEKQFLIIIILFFFICNTSQDEKKEVAYFKSLDSKMVDGIICISGIEEIPSHF